MQTNASIRETNTHRLQSGFRRAALRRVGVPVALVSILVGCLFGTLYTLSFRAMDDAANAPDHRGMGVVAAIVPFYTKMGMTSNVTFMIEGRRAGLRNTNNANTALLRMNDQVPVTYRIGKSGTYYVVGFEPLPHKEQIPLSR